MKSGTSKSSLRWAWAPVLTLTLALSMMISGAYAAEKTSESCLKPAGGPIAQQASNQAPAAPQMATPAVPLARVGKPAPDFEANAFHQGKFKTMKLSDFKGKWVVLCFYPGDFTFV